MENFPGNSHEQKRTQGEPSSQEKKERPQKVVNNQVVQRKKPLRSRLSELVFGGDGKSVAQYVVADVMLPALKDMVADAVSQGIERLIFGENKPANRRPGHRPGGGPINYNRMSGNVTVNRPGESRVMTPRGRASHDFGEIVLQTRAEAEEVISSMLDLLEKYGIVSVSDLYDLVGEVGTHIDEKWGWMNLSSADVRRTRDGYVLNLPRTEQL